MRLEPRNTLPANGSLGDIFVNNLTKEMCFYNAYKWKGMSDGVCYVDFILNSSNELYLQNYTIGEYSGLIVNNTLLSVYEINEDVIGEEYLEYKTSKYNMKPVKIYLNETSCVDYCFKVIDIVTTSRPQLRGYAEFNFIDFNDENIQDGNTLFLAEGINQSFTIGGITHNITSVYIDNMSRAYLEIDEPFPNGIGGRQIDIGETVTFGSYNWTLNNITKARGDYGRTYINITRQ